MNWRDLVEAEKNVTDAGSWQSGTVPRAAFPLSKAGNKAYRPGNKRWRAVRFTVAALECRVLITLNVAFEQFQAMLGAANASGDMRVLATLEFHGTHGTWHCHHTDEEIDKVPPGIKRGAWIRKDEPPKPPPPFTRTIFGLDEPGAYKLACDYFRLDRVEQVGNTLGFKP